MSTSLDPELTWATLTADERATVGGWLEMMGYEVGDWVSLPSLVKILELVVVLRASADVSTPNAGDRIRRAAEALGMEDDPERKTHPGDRFIRRLDDWTRKVRSSGEFLRSRSGEG